MMDFIAPPSKIINGIWPCKQRKEYYPMDQDTFSLQPADPQRHFAAIAALIAIDTKLGYMRTPGVLVME
ncbi:MAG: hypothetical protein A2136_06915 [Chloroflexi bacterium RBG_16_54_11]|nr:MAG: hypothetical protein A2136_06915 [Chloroflexi bacterium RBG_16_54_11]